MCYKCNNISQNHLGSQRLYTGGMMLPTPDIVIYVATHIGAWLQDHKFASEFLQFTDSLSLSSHHFMPSYRIELMGYINE